MARRFRDVFRRLAPAWLIGGAEGELIELTLGVMMDAFVERVSQGLRARLPSHATPTALGALGRDRLVVRGIGETDAAYALRLISWVDRHPLRGNPWGLCETIRTYCQQDVRVRTVDQRGNWFSVSRTGVKTSSLDSGNWDWDGQADTQWSRFWVIIYPTVAGAPWVVEDTWGDPGDYDDGGLWGTTITADHVADIRHIVREWSPNGTHCEWIILAFDDTSFDPTAPEPDGLWGNWSKVVGGVTVPSRLQTARYVRGRGGE